MNERQTPEFVRLTEDEKKVIWKARRVSDSYSYDPNWVSKTNRAIEKVIQGRERAAKERLGALLEALIVIHEQVVMDTPEDQERHDRVVDVFRRGLIAECPRYRDGEPS